MLSAIKLRRITASVAYIPEIDGIRFFAIFSVVIFHVATDVLHHSSPVQAAAIGSSWTFWVANHLSFGVQAFFVLSGFVLALPFAGHYLRGKPASSLGRYYMRRLTRLEPPYILVMLYFFALNAMRARGIATVLLPHLLASIFYQHNLIYGRPSIILTVAWSLEVEVQFYILAPVIAAAALRWENRVHRRVGIAACILIAAAIAAELAPLSPRIYFSLIGQLPYFIAGFLLADIFTLEDKTRPAAMTWDVAGLAAALLVFPGIYFERVTIFVVPLLLFAAFYGAFHGVVIRRILSMTFVSTVGGMCYSIYLLHPYGISLCGRHTEMLGAALPFVRRMSLQFVLMTPVILLISGVFFVLVERPCMQPDWPQRLKRRLLGYRSAETTAEVAAVVSPPARD